MILEGCKEWWDKVRNNECWNGGIAGTLWEDLSIYSREELNTIFIVAGKELVDD